MVRRTHTLDQTLFKASHPKVTVLEVDESELTTFPLDSFFLVSDGALGVACIQGARGILTHIAFATQTHVLCVGMPSLAPAFRTMDIEEARVLLAAQRSRGRKVLQELLQSEDHRKLAFDMDKFAMALYYDFELTIVKAIDIQSALLRDRRSLSTLLNTMGGDPAVHKQAVDDTFFGQGYEEGGVMNVALRAWAACQVDMLPEMTKRLESVEPIDTTVISKRHLEWLAKFTRISWRLYDLKPTQVKNDVLGEFSKSKHALQVSQTRFKTRMRPSATGNQKLHVEFSLADGTTTTTQGRVTQVEGKSARINVQQAVASTAKITKVMTIGKEALTVAEAEREQIVRTVLQQKLSFFELPLVRRIFFQEVFRPARRSSYTCTLAGRSLNKSQAAAVERIISEAPIDRVCLIHGPPGTGKTTVIAASVMGLMGTPKEGRGIWLLAQSNVAVKNIAEKLASVDFLSFKILVSKDFHFEWHEHLYEKIERNVIRSDDFADNSVGTSRLLLDSKVILCTLSMLSNQRLVMAGFTRIVPVETVIVDEASQIELGDYIPLLGRFGAKLNKLVFIGDDKQLAPFGQDDLGDLPSIFELEHLRQDALFLDTQYRMPAPVGAFISTHVYDGRLRTDHEEASRRSCILVDVSRGKETKSGCSWTNPAEIDAVAAIVRRYHSQGKKFRVITPYDAQRNAIEKRLKDTKLPWENKCFNVDSFQGNEEDYIIISLVRSHKPGFLTNLRRTNVMLSRCRRGMIICTSRAFLKGSGRSSLVGKLAQEWPDGWVSWKDILQGRF